jgi:hypothetical protein
VSGDRQPRPGDRVAQPKDFVEVRYRAYFLAWSGAGDGEAFVAAGDGKFSAPPGATVEVLEPADDPSNDPVWTVRTVEPPPYPGVDSNIVIKFGQDHWMYPYRNGYGRLDWADVNSSRVIGVVPGTPAAEQHMHNAGYCGACNMVHDRREYVPPVEPEEIDASTLFPPPVGTAPRVFKSDGPEPPADVTVLIDSKPDPEESSFPYLVRTRAGWCWSPSAELIAPDFCPPGPWTERAPACVGDIFLELRR